MEKFTLKEFIIKVNNNNNDYVMNNYERYAPFVILFILILILLLSRGAIIKNKKLENRIRLIMAFITGGTLTFYYIGNFIINGFDISNLPIHLCYLCSIFSVILLINKNKKIFNFILVCGVVGGLSSFISIDLSLSSLYLKYYKFVIGHIAIIIIPIYFIVIYNYDLKIKELLDVFIELEIMAIIIGIFNSHFKTNYFFVSFNSNFAAKGTILETLGQGYKYFINLELIVVFYFFIVFLLLKILEYKRIKNK